MDDLTPEQADRLAKTVARNLRFLKRLCGRLNQLQFEPGDQLNRAANTARNAMQDLHVAALYARCKRPPGAR